jgi:hypothetical protein
MLIWDAADAEATAAAEVDGTSTETNSEAPDADEAGGVAVWNTVAWETRTPSAAPVAASAPTLEFPPEPAGPVCVGTTEPAPGVSTSITWSPVSTPSEGSWPSFNANPTTALPLARGRDEVTSPREINEPDGMVTAAQVPDRTDASATGTTESPPDVATSTVPRSLPVMRWPCRMVVVTKRTGTL